MAGVAMSRGRARGPTGHAHGVAYLAAAHVLGHAAQAWAHENTVPAVPRNTDRDSRELSWTGDASPLETYATDCQLPDVNSAALSAGVNCEVARMHYFYTIILWPPRSAVELRDSAWRLPLHAAGT